MMKNATSTSSSSLENQSASFVTNQKWVLKSRPNGIFDPETDSELLSERINLECEADEIICETETLSVDAFIRTMLDEEAYHGVVAIGSTLPAIGYGKVIKAGSAAKYKTGSKVMGMLGAQTYAKVKANAVFPKINFPFMPESASLGLMGLTTGLTAYTGVFYVCPKPKRGETAVVTGAAGAVGSVAAQLAKSTGAKVIGTAGGSHKKAYLVEEMKLDGCVDYKDSENSVTTQLNELCPHGIDFIYDNVGGEILDDLLMKINPKGRVVICGAVSQYSGNLNKGLVRGPSNYLKLSEQGATMKGFNVMQYMSKILFAMVGMFWMFLRGKVDMKEHIENGIESFPLALNKLFTGGHIGKMLVNVKKVKAD
jgi:hypothetical protein